MGYGKTGNSSSKRWWVGPTIENYNERISVVDPKFDYYKDYYSQVDEDLKSGKYGPQWAGLGLINKFDTNHLEKELININNDAGILEYEGIEAEIIDPAFTLRRIRNTCYSKK